jgi:hypothetical protein
VSIPALIQFYAGEMHPDYLERRNSAESACKIVARIFSMLEGDDFVTAHAVAHQSPTVARIVAVDSRSSVSFD